MQTLQQLGTNSSTCTTATFNLRDLNKIWLLLAVLTTSKYMVRDISKVKVSTSGNSKLAIRRRLSKRVRLSSQIYSHWPLKHKGLVRKINKWFSKETILSLSMVREVFLPTMTPEWDHKIQWVSLVFRYNLVHWWFKQQFLHQKQDLKLLFNMELQLRKLVHKLHRMQRQPFNLIVRSCLKDLVYSNRTRTQLLWENL